MPVLDLNTRSTCLACSYTRNIPKRMHAARCVPRSAIKCNYFKYESAHTSVMKIEIDACLTKTEKETERRTKRERENRGRERVEQRNFVDAHTHTRARNDSRRARVRAHRPVRMLMTPK